MLIPNVLTKRLFLTFGKKEKTITFANHFQPKIGVWRSPASAPALGAGGRRFESCYPDIEYYFPGLEIIKRQWVYGRVAQLDRASAF